MNSFIIFLEFFTFLFGLGLGLYVFLKNPKSELFQAFGLTTLGVVGWNLSIFWVLSELEPMLLFGKLAFSFSGFLAAGFLWFVLQYPQPVKWKNKLRWFAWAMAGGLFLLPLGPWWLTEITVENGFIEGNLHPVIQPMWTLTFMLVFLIAFCIMMYRSFSLRGIERKRVRQVLIGFLLFFLPTLATNSLLPTLFNDPRWNNLGPVFTVLLFTFLTAAILQYRLLNIRWIVGKSFLLSIVGTLIVSFFIAVTFLISDLVSQPLAIGASALIIAIAFRPLEKSVTRLISRLVNKGSYDPAEATRQVFEVVRTYGDLEQLNKKIGELFSRYFSAEEIGIIVFETNSDKVLNAQLHGVDEAVLKKTKDLLAISKWYGNNIVEAGELRWRLEYTPDRALSKKDAKALPVLEQLRIEALIPFIVENKVIGFMLFGKRRYDRALKNRDIQFLDLIRSGISPALENAAKYAEIKKLYEQVSEADRVKSQFIDVVSHRFRTPLSALRWNIETVLENSRLGKDAKEMLTDSHDRTIFLVNTLEGLFDALELQDGKLKLNIAKTNLQKITQPVIASFERQAREKGLEFSANVPSIVIPADAKRLQMVISMLLANGIEYTSKGGVSLTAKRTNGSVKISVQDTGIGIPKKDQEKIFEKFYRASNAVQAYADGQGLGLYLARALAEKHKGTIDVVSEEGKGTTVTLTLPAK